VQYWGGFRCYLREARGNVLISVIFYIFLFPVKKVVDELFSWEWQSWYKEQTSRFGEMIQTRIPTIVC